MQSITLNFLEPDETIPHVGWWCCCSKRSMHSHCSKQAITSFSACMQRGTGQEARYLTGFWQMGHSGRRVCVCVCEPKYHGQVNVFASTHVCVHPHLHLCVCVGASSAICIRMCGTVDQNRALTVAGLLLADACLEELTATRPVNHLVRPPAFSSHGPILLALNPAVCCLYTLCTGVWSCGVLRLFPLTCVFVTDLAAWTSLG